MPGKNIAVFGIYRSQSEVGEAVDGLIAAGYRNGDISVLLPDHRARTSEDKPVLSGALGWLTRVEALAIPGLGAFVAAGPMPAALAGAAASGGLAGTGAFSGALVAMGAPEHDAQRYEGRVRSGGLLLTVHCASTDWSGRAKKILRDTGAEDIGSAALSEATGAR